jgi:superfamily II RNA helicase
MAKSCLNGLKVWRNKEHGRIESITQRLDPLRSNDIQYPQSKETSSLIVEFILTLKEKQLLPCIVFTDNRTLCEQMANAVAVHFRRTEENVRATKYKHQIDLLKERVEQGERMRKKTKPTKVS